MNDRIKLAEARGFSRGFADYEYIWAVNQRKGPGQADWYFEPPDDEPDYQGWENVEKSFWRDDHTDNYYFRRKLPEATEDGWRNAGGERVALPDPFTDANDCEALMRWLANGERRNGLSYVVQIEVAMERVNDAVEIWVFGARNRSVLQWEGSDYKQGVCELALKVIE